MSVYQYKISTALRQTDIIMLNRFRKFVHSPYFNSNEAITTLFEILYEHIKNENISKNWSNKKEIFSECYPDEKYKDSRLRKLFSDLLRLFEDFLSEENFREQKLLETSQLLSSLSENHSSPLYNQVIKKARVISERSMEKSAEYYFYQYKIEKEIYNIEEYEIKRSQKLNVENILSNLDKFYFAEKLKYYYKILSQKNVVEHDYEILFLNEILDHIENTDYREDPHIYLHYLVVQLSLQKDNESLLQEVKDSIDKHIEIFPQNEARDIYNAAINFCIRQLNQGKTEYLQEVFDLYVSGLDAEALLFKDELTPNTFRNIVICGLRLSHFEWVEGFIDNYAYLLNEEYRENAVRFNKARLYFYTEKFAEVIPLLAQVEFSDITYSLGAKALLMATYYELDEADVLISFIDSFRTYLSRHKSHLPESRYQNYLNLASFVRRLTFIPPGDQKAIQDIEDDIEKSSGIADISWLKEKIEELKS